MDIRIALTGFGSVGQGLATLLIRYGADYQRRYGVNLLLTGVADRGGGVTSPAGLHPESLLETKLHSASVASHAAGVVGLGGGDFLDRSSAHVLIEAASTNFQDAEPGWSYACGALEREMDVIFASKGSLATHWADLMAIAHQHGRQVLYSATVGAPVPSLQLAERVLIGAEIQSFEGILNGTTHQILTAMGKGLSYQEGVRQAQEMGIAETDPTLDVDGWDAAAKVTILSNSIFGTTLTVHDVERTGIREVTANDLNQARADDRVIKLIGRAIREHGEVRASVAPEQRPINDALGRLTGDDMGIVFHTRPLGAMSATVESSGGSGGISTAMTVLRDLLNLAGDRGWSQ